MLSPNKINLAARMKGSPQGKPRLSGAARALLPFAAVAMAVLAIVAVLLAGADSLFMKTLDSEIAVLTPLEEAYADALALSLRRDEDAMRLYRLEALVASLETYPQYSSEAHSALYAAAGPLGVEIQTLAFDMDTGVITLSCTAAKPDSAALYAESLGESFALVLYDGYTLSGNGVFSFSIKCLIGKEGH